VGSGAFVMEFPNAEEPTRRGREPGRTLGRRLETQKSGGVGVRTKIQMSGVISMGKKKRKSIAIMDFQ